MQIYLFGKNSSIGDKVILSSIQGNKNYSVSYMGEKVDLSKIKNPQNHNIIIVSNPLVFNLDFAKLFGLINKDLEKPLILVKKIRAFGAITYKPNFLIDKILVNKIYVFGGVLYIPKEYLKNTMADIFRELPVDKVRSYII